MSRVIALMGYTDTIAIVDSGYPEPANVTRIDLSLTPGVPGIVDVAKVVAAELEVERVIYATESDGYCPEPICEAASLFPGADTW